VVTVAYLGPPGTFTDAALHRLRADARTSALLADLEAVPAGTPEDALAMVRTGAADYACVPFENSVDGTVNPTSDALAVGEPLQIFAETELDVVFSILVRPGTDAADVRVLRTHPVAAAQVRRWVGVHLPQAHIETTSSTAAGAEEVAAGAADATAAGRAASALLKDRDADEAADGRECDDEEAADEHRDRHQSHPAHGRLNAARGKLRGHRRFEFRAGAADHRQRDDDENGRAHHARQESDGRPFSHSHRARRAFDVQVDGHRAADHRPQAATPVQHGNERQHANDSAAD